MEDKIKKMARAGYAAKGTVYAITGVLAFMAAFNMGGQKAGKLEVLEFLEKQPFGKVLLAIIGIGLACYAVWRLIQSIQDPEGIGSDGKGMAKRAGFFISGVIYLGLGIYAIVKIFSDSYGSSSGGSGSQSLSGDLGTFVFMAIGAGLAIKGIYQFIKAYKGDFLKKFNISAMAQGTKRTFIKNTGYAGLIARGVLVCIVAYFFLKAGSEGSASGSSFKGTADAFSFLQQNSSGPYLMGIVAAGLVCYGVYMITMARYRSFQGQTISSSDDLQGGQATVV